jgi:N12 class adenine-specific DNA methylase
MDALEAELYGTQEPEPDYVEGQGKMDQLERELADVHPPDQPAPVSVSDRRPAGQTPAPPAKEPGFFGQAVEGFRGGMEGQNVRSTGQFTQDVAAMLESERLASVGRSIEQVGAKREHPAAVKSLRDIHALKDVVPYAGYQIGQGVASSLPSLAAGLAGAAAGGAVAGPIGAFLGAAAGAAGTSYVQNEGDISQELEELRTAAPGTAPGMLTPGNIDMSNRPEVHNPDGTISTIRSISFEENGKEILIPTVSDDGRILSDDEAIAHYHQTGAHLGTFTNAAAATAYAERLHQQQALAHSPEGQRQRAADAMRIAVPVAAFDVIPTGRLLRILTGGRAPVEIAKRGLMAGLKRIAIETGKQGLTEGATEGIQEAMQAVGTHRAVGQPVNALETLERSVEAAVAGGLAGAAMGGATQTYDETREGLRGQTEPAGADGAQPGGPPPSAGASLPPAGGPEGPSAPPPGGPIDQLLDDNQPVVSEEELSASDTEAPMAQPGTGTPEQEQQGPPVSRETEPVGPYDTQGAMRALEKARGREREANEISDQLEAERSSPISEPPEPTESEPPEGEEASAMDALEQEMGEGPRPPILDMSDEELAQAFERHYEEHGEESGEIGDEIDRRHAEAEPEAPAGPHPGIQQVPGSSQRWDIATAPTEREEPTWQRADAAPAPKLRKKEAWLGTATEPESGWMSDGHMAFRKEDVQPKQAKMLAHERDDTRSGIKEAAVQQIVDIATKETTGKKGKVLEELGRKEKLPVAMRHGPKDVSGYTLLAAKDGTTVVVNTQKLELLRQVSHFDELRGSDPQKPITAHRDGKVVGVLMPLRHEVSPEDVARLREAPQAPAAGEPDLAINERRAPGSRRNFFNPRDEEKAKGKRGLDAFWSKVHDQSWTRPDLGEMTVREGIDLLRTAREQLEAATTPEQVQRIHQALGELYGRAGSGDLRGEIGNTRGAANRKLKKMGVQPDSYSTPKAETKVEEKKPATPQIPHGVDGSTGYVLPSFATHGAAKNPQEGTIEDVIAKTQAEVAEVERQIAEQGPSAGRRARLKGAQVRLGQLEGRRTRDRGNQWWDGASRRDREAVFLNAGVNPEDATRWAQLAYADLSQKDQALVEKRATPLAEKGSTPKVSEALPASVEEKPDTSKEPASAAPPAAEVSDGPVREDLAGRTPASEPESVPDAGAAEGAEPPGPVVRGDRGGRGGVNPERPAGERPAAEGGDGAGSEVRPASPGREGDRDEPHARGAGRAQPGQLAGSNYRLTDADRIGEGTPTEKVQGNLVAIRLLKEIEARGTPATRDEQAVLAKYVGWGGLADVFDPKKGLGVKHGPELAALLSEEEFQSAKASTPNAHYTSVQVIQSIFDALTRMGLNGGKLLEPSMGVGNFLGLTPQAWRAQWSGVELDAITGRIGKLLYPKAAVRVNGFETVEFPDGSFDAAISNVPFGDYPVSSRRYEKKGKFLTSAIHNFFFAKALDLVRPGGIVAFVTSRYTMDAASERLRNYLGERADLLGAVRLPSMAFKENADTEVVTDVIFLRKREAGAAPAGEAWTERTHIVTPSNDFIHVNEYYKAHPEMIVGDLREEHGRYGREATVRLPEGADFRERLEAALARLPNGVYTPAAIESPATSPAADEAALEAPGDVKEGGFAIRDAKLYQRFDGKLRVAEIPSAAADRVRRQVEMIEQIRGLIQAERLDRPEADVETRRKKLREAYRSFVKKYGPVTMETRTSYIDKNGKEVVRTAFPNLKIVRDDPASSFLFALEHDFDIETGKAQEGGILHHRTVKPERNLEQASTAQDALPYVLNETGRVDLEKIARLTGQTPDEVGRELFHQGLIYDDPASTEWVPTDEYLSGDVRAKLALAREAEKREPRYRKHREALEKVIPEDLTPGQIHVAAGAPWIPTRDVEAFVNHLAGGNISPTVRYLDHDGSWHIKGYYSSRGGAQVDWGTDRIDWLKVVELAFNNKAPLITDPGPPGGPDRVKNIEATAAAEAKWQAVKDKFAQWIWEDGKRADRLARYYNDHFNNIRLWEPDGSHLTFPGMTKTLRGAPFTLQKHQANAVWRIVRGGNTLLAHVVGAGKTFTMQAAGMEAKRLGLAKKPIFAVPGNVLGQFARDFRELYPSAQLLIAEASDVSKEGRARFQAKVTGSNWDGIVMTHDSFERIQMSLEFQQEFLRDQVRELEALLEDEKARGDRKSATVKDIEKAKKRLKAKIEKLGAEWKKDEHLEFEALGLDMLFVDEAHKFKNLWIASRRRGVAMDGSQRAFDLYLKTRYLDQQRPGWGAVFATGTPIANSVGEMFTMQRYLQYRLLAGQGLRNFDGWASTFGEDVTGLEMKPDGSGYRMKTRFARFKNLPELARMFRLFADVKLAEDLKLPVPKLLGGKPAAIVSRASMKLKTYIKSLLKRAQELSGKDPSEDNWLKIVGDGRHAALDIRFVDSDPTADPEAKVAQAANRIAEIWEETREHRGTQLVFSDLGTPKEEQKKAPKPKLDEDGLEEEEGEGFELTPRGGVAGFNIYSALKAELAARGVPAGEIAFIHEANSEPKKLRLWNDMNSGKVRVLIGSTEKLGAGTNVQQRLVALHHLDAPWRPADVEQREGRILRQGNLLYNAGKIEGVRILRYVTQESFDAFMWSTLERKAFMIAQVMKGDMTMREMEDIDAPLVADFAQMKAITSGNPAVMEKVEVDAKVQKLDRQKKAHLDAQFRIRQQLLNLPKAAESFRERAAKVRKDLERREDTKGDKFKITLGGKEFTKRPEAGTQLRQALQQVLAKHAATFNQGGTTDLPQPIGSFAGFDLVLQTLQSSLSRAKLMIVGDQLVYVRDVDGADTPQSILSTLEHAVADMEKEAERADEIVADREREISELESRVGQPFEKQADLDAALKRQAELNVQLTKQAEPENGATVQDREEDDEGDGIELRHSFPGDLPHQIRELLDRRKEREAVLAPFPEEIEESWQNAKGLQEATLREQFRRKLQEVKESLRHFGKIDPTAGPLEARANEILLEVEGAQSWAQAQAIHQIREVIKGLTEPEVDLLTRHFALHDLQKDVEAGLYEGKSLPFVDTPAQLEAALATVRQAVSENPKVARGIHARARLARAMTEQLVAADQLPASVLKDDRYYHRQVLEYFNALPPQTQRPGTSAQEMRVHRKGFQKARVGGGEFNTAYHQAEFEWLAQAHRILHMVEKLEELKQLGDVRDRLKAEAKQVNAERLAAMAPEQVKEALEEFGQKIGRATGELLKMAREGKLTLPGFEHMLAALNESYGEWRAQPRRKPGEGPRPGFRFNHPQWFPFLKRLLEQPGEADGKIQAAVIFKALHQREEKIKELLGRQYRTWEDLIPTGYRIWQPVKGNHFFQALGVAERALQQYLAGERTLQESDFRDMLVLGPAREQWVIPEWMADTMDGFGKKHDTSAFGRAWVYLENQWKRFQLLMPLRLLKYNFNNLSGDFDATMLAPGLHRHTRKAVADLWAYRKGKASAVVTEEIHQWMKLRVIDQGMTVVEIPDLDDIAGFEHLADPNPFRFMYWVHLYWRKARGLTLFRENIFRLASARYFFENPRAPALASNQKELQHFKDPLHRAAKMSRDLIGDYGNISEAGQWARERVAPFFSWQEINAKRYVTVLRNLTMDEGDRKRAVGFLGLRTARYTLRRILQLNAFFLMLSLWNRLFFPDEDDEMRERGRNLHLLLGRYKDGSVRSIRIEGAWADFLEWLHLHDYPADVRDLVEGKRTVMDKVQEMVRSPLEKIVGLWEPVSKTLFEVLTKKATYPTPFDTRPIRDRAEHVAGALSLQWLYREVTDKPNPPGSGYTQFLLMRTDPGEAAYFGLKQRVSDWQAKHGKERSNPDPTDRDNALYYWRKALEWGEEEKADRWLQRYYNLGGTRDLAKQSMKRAAPLRELSEHERRAFLRDLDPEGREMLELAKTWYARGLRATAGPSMGRTRPTPKGAQP